MTLSFSGDGSLLVSGASDGQISLWQIDGNVRLLDIASGMRRIHDITFSPGGTSINRTTTPMKARTMSPTMTFRMASYNRTPSLPAP